MRRQIYNLAVLIFCVGVLPCTAYAQPGIPEEFYGSANVATGTILTAFINGVAVASTTVESENVYGYAPTLFLVPDSNGTEAGETISFKIDGQSVPQTASFTNGAITELDLAISDEIATSTQSAIVFPDATTGTDVATGSGGSQSAPSTASVVVVSTSTPRTSSSSPSRYPHIVTADAARAPRIIFSSPTASTATDSLIASTTQLSIGNTSLAAAPIFAGGIPLVPLYTNSRRLLWEGW